jgi:hypothetical protein
MIRDQGLGLAPQEKAATKAASKQMILCRTALCQPEPRDSSFKNQDQSRQILLPKMSATLAQYIVMVVDLAASLRPLFDSIFQTLLLFW